MPKALGPYVLLHTDGPVCKAASLPTPNVAQDSLLYDYSPPGQIDLSSSTGPGLPAVVDVSRACFARVFPSSGTYLTGLLSLMLPLWVG